MYICICNPFTDKDVKNHLETLVDTTRISEVYHACSGGEGMNCGSCACELKKMVDNHNSSIAVSRISQSLEKIVHKVEHAA